MNTEASAVEVYKQNPMVLNEKSHKTVKTLINASHRKLLQLDTVVPWADGVDLNKPPKIEEAGWLYGTPYWDALTPAQRSEVLWLETARDVSYFIWLEQSLPELYVGYVNKYHGGLSDDVREYLMIFSREEIVHTLMFRRYLETAKLPLWSHPENIPNFSKFEDQLAGKHPVYGIIWNLLIEWFAELNSIYQTQHDIIDPLTRTMFREHHTEELRHIAFARHVAENYFANAPAGEIDEVSDFFKKGYVFLLDEYTYMPEIARFTSFEFPIAIGDTEKIKEIRNSPNNLRLNEARFRDVREWCQKYKIID
ncbi:diiron oxygenase [Janthinobacterium sp. CG3]|uniref:diiron oxygenase n=2 Tax=unclassified Janthinobacterium TaxID=2610881 RepID=UPI0003476BEF|nr:diadenosine tetraphosphatase ApaH/serine/threonine PP2A family protein phosphatase [Janthinobacterium sp. CG_S6]